LISRSLQLQFGGNYSITVPRVVSSASDLEFVAEAAPLPVQMLGLAGTTLTPFKIGGIFSFTRELLEHSIPNAERLTRAVLQESIGLVLDMVLFDANPASSTRPAGLRNGVAALSAAPAGGDAAMFADIKALMAGVQGVGGLNVVLIASPPQALALLLRAGPDFNTRVQVLASNALASGTVMVVAINALAIAADPVPRIEQSRSATLHFEDSAPAQIVSGTTPPPTLAQVATPVRSLWQMDAAAVRLIMEISWALRTMGAVAWVQNTTW
jgi:hypothetical protein